VAHSCLWVVRPLQAVLRLVEQPEGEETGLPEQEG
jgi:hypothetical protein